MSPTWYSVNYWGSKPHTDDDCHSGTDYSTLNDALAAYEGKIPSNIAWVELDGPNIHQERPNPDYKPTEDTDEELWRREQRMQAAMGLGIRGWNDFEGYENETVDC